MIRALAIGSLLFVVSCGTLFGGVVYRVPVEETIDLGLPPFIERAISEAEEKNASAIVLDIDTFGGRVDGATQIKDAILSSKVKTVAFVNRRAISAGALIAMSCETVVMTGGATMGAATAVDLSGKKASEKVISYMREEMAATAERRGRNTLIAQAMVDEEIHFTEVEVGGTTIHVDDLEGAKEGKLVTLTTEKALKYGFSDGKAETFDEVLQFLGLEGSEVIDLRVNWSEKIVRFLTEPTVSSLLMTLGFLGLLFELQSPGWGVSGTIGLILLGLFFGASLFARLATMTELLILAFGVALILLEIFAFPGFGAVGIAGALTVLASFFMMLLPDHPIDTDLTAASWGFTIGLLGAIAATVLIGRMLVRTELWRKMTLPTSERVAEGYAAVAGLGHLSGAEGTAITDLKPSGWVKIGTEKVFAISDGDFILKESKVKVQLVEGNRVVVRSLTS